MAHKLGGAPRLPALCIPGTLCDKRLFEAMLGNLNLDAVHPMPIAQAEVGEAADAVLTIAPPRAVAIGFSLGGFVVLELVRRYPERVAAAVLIASNTQAMPPAGAADRRAEVVRARSDGMSLLISDVWPRYVARASVNDEALRATVLAMAESVGVDRFAAQAELAIGRPDSSATLAASGVPCLLLSGSEDEVTPRERYRKTAVDSDACWVELAGVGHFPPLEAPRRSAAAIADWLSEVAPCC